MSVLEFMRANTRFLGSGALLTFLSSFGQTYFIAIFAAEIMSAFDLSDGQWGGVYSVSTLASAIVMLWAGTLTDRFRVRQLVWFVMPALALACFAMAANRSILILFIVIFFLRLFGQGMMSQLAVTAMARWFSARRGLALSISSLGFSAGQATLPIILAAAIMVVDWRLVWVAGGILVLACLPLIHGFLSQERTPANLAKENSGTGMGGRHWTRNEVLKSSVFWLLLPMLLGPPAWGTALFFQQVHIAAAKGWPLVEYLALVPLLTIVAVISTIVSGQMIDKLGSGVVARAYLLPFAFGFLLIGLADDLWLAALGMVFFGMGTGMQATLPAAFWSEYFGTRHIGAIKAVSTSIMVTGSAIGPGISGLLIDLGYTFPEQMLAITLYFLAATVLVWIAVARVDAILSPSKIDVERP